MQSVDKAQTDYKLAVANGSTDPTFSFDVGRNPPIDAYFGVDVSFPLRIFDRNQGNKLHTKLDITRNEKLRDAAEAQVFSDVDSAMPRWQQSDFAAALQAEISGAGGAGAGHDFIFLSARRGFAAGFS
jgi:outer membrane protein TolC